MQSSALTSRREQDRILRQACAAQKEITVFWNRNDSRSNGWSGRFVAYETSLLWLDVPELLSGNEPIADRTLEVRFSMEQPLRVICTAIGRAPRLGIDGRLRLLLSTRRPLRIEPALRPTSFILRESHLRGVAATLIDVDDARLTYSPRPVRITNQQIVLVTDPPEEFHDGDLFQLQLAIPGDRTLTTLIVRLVECDKRNGGTTAVTFVPVPGDEGLWTAEPLRRLGAFALRVAPGGSAQPSLTDFRDVEIPC